MAAATTIPDLFNAAQVIALVGGVIIPFLVAVIARAKASPNVLTFLAFIGTGLLALGTYLTDTGGAHTWKGALSVFVLSAVSAAASRYTFTEQWVKAVHAKTPGVVG